MGSILGAGSSGKGAEGGGSGKRLDNDISTDLSPWLVFVVQLPIALGGLVHGIG